MGAEYRQPGAPSGSLGVATAHSLGWIVAGRALQGTGAAAFPIGLGGRRVSFRRPALSPA
jgi:hypothetical protein